MPRFALIPALFLTLFMLLSTSALAQDQEFSADHLAAASQLASLQKADTTYVSVLGAVIRDSSRLFLQTNPDLEADINDTAKLVETQIEAEAALLNQKIVLLYAQTFSLEELQSILTFFQTPAGLKLANQRSELENKVVEETILWGEELSEKVVTLMRSELQEKGHRL